MIQITYYPTKKQQLGKILTSESEQTDKILTLLQWYKYSAKSGHVQFQMQNCL
mgnify:CR=1 FL=1